jgi:hypothetical protein
MTYLVATKREGGIRIHDGNCEILVRRFRDHWQAISYESMSRVMKTPIRVKRTIKSIFAYLTHKLDYKTNTKSHWCTCFSPFCRSPIPFFLTNPCRAQTTVPSPVDLYPDENFWFAWSTARRCESQIFGYKYY